MRTKLFNVFSAIINIAITIACIVSLAMMIVYDRGGAIYTCTFYLTILTFGVSFYSLHYNVESFDMSLPMAPKWFIIFRLITVTSLLVNMLASFALAGSSTWSLAYFIPRLIIPILYCINYLFFDIDTKTPAYGIIFTPILFIGYLSIMIPLATNEIVPPIYDYLDSANNSWFVTVLVVVCIVASAYLISSGLYAINSLIHRAAYGENDFLLEQAYAQKKLFMDEPEEVEDFLQENDLDTPLDPSIEVERVAPRPASSIDTRTRVIKKIDIEKINHPHAKGAEKIQEKLVEEERLDSKEKPLENGSEKPIEQAVENKEINETKNIKKDTVKSKTASSKKTANSSQKLRKTPVNKVEKPAKPKEIKKNNPKSATVKTASKKTNTTTIKKVENTSKIAKKKQSETTTKTATIKKINTSTKATKIVKEKTASKPDVIGGDIYHVSHHPSQNKWQVKLENGGRALKLFKTQLDAINFAKELVKNKGGSILIHSVNGRVRKA